jgi:tRNA A37 methylthiotransferase MiaB
MKFAFYTLGCKVNQYETQAMERLLTELGHEIGSFEDCCDGYIINTCSVTAVADKKNRAVIRRTRKAHPGAMIAVCGCYTQHARRLPVNWGWMCWEAAAEGKASWQICWRRLPTGSTGNPSMLP